MVDGVLDSGQGTDDALVVGDVLVAVEGNVEVDLVEGESALALLNLEFET
jgi:hypothetical protein